MDRRRSRSRRILLAVVATVLVLGACSSGAGGEQSGQPAAGAGSGDPLDLRGVCPDPIVVQTSWWPGAESFGALYSLVGPNPQIDGGKKRVTAPLTAQGKDTGVKLELRAGGPAIGFVQATAQLYADPSAHLAVPSAPDEVIQLSKTQPSLAVLALVDIDPQLILWDPQKHPEFHTIVDIGQTDTTVIYFGGDTYMEYLVGSGVLRRSQVDGSYDGSPARFVAERGEVAQSGYATSDPYVYEKVVKEWGRPVDFQLVYDTGYPNYGSLLSIRTRDKGKLAPCLKKLVPIVQQAQIDIITKPDTVNRVIDLILKLNQDYKSEETVTRESSLFAVGQEKKLGLTGNGAPPDGIIGNFNEARIQRMIDITRPIFTAANKPIKDGLRPSDVVTNEFIDPKIGVK